MHENSKNLDKAIKAFKEKIISKNDMIVFEPNKFDLFIDDIFNIVWVKYKKIDKFLVKNLLIKSGLFVKNNLKFFRGSLKNIFRSINSLEKKIEAQQDLLLKTIEFNQELANTLNKFDNKINSVILENSNNKKRSHLNLEIENKMNDNFINKKNENTKLNIIQDENLRISNELFESRKKLDIMKLEIERFNKQRSNLINKINSVNEIINDSNVLTNVFENNVEEKKINVLDPEKKIIENDNLDKLVKNIFLKK